MFSHEVKAFAADKHLPRRQPTALAGMVGPGKQIPFAKNDPIGENVSSGRCDILANVRPRPEKNGANQNAMYDHVPL
jgi:hypothetical protein